MRRRLPDHKVRKCGAETVSTNRLCRGYYTPEPCVAAPLLLMPPTGILGKRIACNQARTMHSPDMKE